MFQKYLFTMNDIMTSYSLSVLYVSHCSNILGIAHTKLIKCTANMNIPSSGIPAKRMSIVAHAQSVDVHGHPIAGRYITNTAELQPVYRCGIMMAEKP